MTKAIISEVVVAYSQCHRKAFLLLNSEDRGAAHEYVRILEEQSHLNQVKHLDAVKQKNPGLSSCCAADLTSGDEAFIEVPLKYQDLEAYCDILTKVQPGSASSKYSYEPTIIVGTRHITKEHKLQLSFTGYVLGQLQNWLPENGTIVAGGQSHKVDLKPAYKILKMVLQTLRQWMGSPLSEPPPVILNKHCPCCPFQDSCRAKAEQEDSISLLDGISTPKVVQKYEKQGIFTVRQLSYLYKPRRRKKRVGRPALTHKPELQALAIRTRKIYVQELSEMARKPVELFLDIEGIPDAGFYYLIGLLVCEEKLARFYSFWADTSQDEGEMWRQFLEQVHQYPEAPIYHYGHYDQKAIQKLAERYGTPPDTLNGRLININNYIYGKIYFPSRSNGLKELGRLIGAAWSSPNASGLQTLVWRHHWDANQDLTYKNLLITYNREDCQALKLLTDELSRIKASAHTLPEVDFADKPKRHATDFGQHIHTQFGMILEFAHAKYDERKIKFRQNEEPQEVNQENSKKKGEPGVKKGYQGQRRIRPKATKIVWVPLGETCPEDLEPVRPSERIAKRLIIDLVQTKNGMKKTITEYSGYQGYCPKCYRFHSPPGIREFGPNQLYGHGFQSWVVYQRVGLRMTYGAIAEAMREQFKEKEPGETIAPFIRNLSHYYANTEKIIMQRLLEAPFIHSDETPINVRGATQYVWTFTNDRYVILKLRKTREATIVHEFLAQYAGVLISDFYSGYDSVTCRQQKCWVHLIRELNDDLWENPFDMEYERFVSEVKALIIPIMEAVKTCGLKKRHLHKFTKPVNEFYKKAIVDISYKSELILKYQKRLIKYRESLFTFLELDGIPWHNNTAERALRHIAKQQQVSGQLHEALTHDYLRLLSIRQTCRFQGKSFLRFLFSREIDIDQFKR